MNHGVGRVQNKIILFVRQFELKNINIRRCVYCFVATDDGFHKVSIASEAGSSVRVGISTANGIRKVSLVIENRNLFCFSFGF
ncbi:MAG: hypothetical protein ACI8Q3_001287 [Marinomonas primoryensis]|jgi:hypothetical protein